MQNPDILPEETDQYDAGYDDGYRIGYAMGEVERSALAQANSHLRIDNLKLARRLTN